MSDELHEILGFKTSIELYQITQRRREWAVLWKRDTTTTAARMVHDAFLHIGTQTNYALLVPKKSVTVLALVIWAPIVRTGGIVLYSRKVRW